MGRGYGSGAIIIIERGFSRGFFCDQGGVEVL